MFWKNAPQSICAPESKVGSTVHHMEHVLDAACLLVGKRNPTKGDLVVVKRVWGTAMRNYHKSVPCGFHL